MSDKVKDDAQKQATEAARVVAEMFSTAEVQAATLAFTGMVCRGLEANVGLAAQHVRALTLVIPNLLTDETVKAFVRDIAQRQMVASFVSMRALADERPTVEAPDVAM
jgi:hypothetical protein